MIHQGIVLVETNRSMRVLETSHPPVYYIPPSDVQMDYFLPNPSRSSFCEWKGMAKYYDLNWEGKRIPQVAWYYPNPSKNFMALADHLAFYPSRFDGCYVNDEQVQAQEGDFYGGWITSNIVGPFKGASGTWGW